MAISILHRELQTSDHPCRINTQSTIPGVQLIEGHIDGNTGPLVQAFSIACDSFGFQVRPQIDRSLLQRQLGVIHDRRGIGTRLRSDSFAVLTPAELTVERKIVRRQRIKTATTSVAGQMLAVFDDLPMLFRRQLPGVRSH